jgi:hypothetical protein
MLRLPLISMAPIASAIPSAVAARVGGRGVGREVTFIAKSCELGHQPFDFFCHSAYFLKERNFL